MKSSNNYRRMILHIFIGLGIVAVTAAIIFPMFAKAHSFSGPGYRREFMVKSHDRKRARRLEQQGDASLAAKDYDNAERLYKESLEINPYRCSTWRSMALVERNNMKKAYEKFIQYSDYNRISSAQDREALVRYVKLCQEVGDLSKVRWAESLIESIDSRAATTKEEKSP